MEQTKNVKKKKQKEPKKIANYSLLLMAVGFASFIPFQEEIWQKILLGAFEAGVVGALADWFAVTALFRHPLGIPIPHTALLPKNRDKMTSALVNTLENDWLNKESIEEKVAQIKFAEKILEITKSELRKKEMQEKILSFIQQSVSYIKFEKFSPILEKNIRKFMVSVDSKMIVQKAADELIKHKYDEKVLDLALGKIKSEAEKGKIGDELARTILREIEKRKANSIFNIALKTFKSVADEKKLSEVITNVLVQKADDLRSPEDQHRKLILSYVQKEIEDVKENEKVLAEIENWKNGLIENWDVEKVIQQGITAVEKQLHDFVHSETFMEKHLIPMIEKVISSLENNPERIEKIETWIKEKVITIIEQNHSKIGQLVQTNLDKLNNEQLIYMVEEKLGKDLSWIRVNGAICGFLIGLVLSCIKIFV